MLFKFSFIYLYYFLSVFSFRKNSKKITVSHFGDPTWRPPSATISFFG